MTRARSHAVSNPLGLAMCAVLALAACNDRAPLLPVDDEMVLGPEDVVEVKQQRIEAGPLISGTLEPAARAYLRAEVPGSVARVDVELGDRVRRGQLLARIEEQGRRSAVGSARQSLRAAEADAAMAERQVERAERLVQAGAAAGQDLEQAQSAVSAARARVEQARAALVTSRDQLTSGDVTAPFDGVVSERLVGVGDVVSPGTPLFALIDPGTMRLAASVPSDALAGLRPGQSVTFEVRGTGARAFRGSLERIAPVADPTTRQVTVLATLQDPEGELVAGLFTTGRVLTEARDAIAIPMAALLDTAGPPTALRVQGERVVLATLRLGLRDDVAEIVEVVEGLSPGDRVLVGAARALRPGTRVRLRGAGDMAAVTPGTVTTPARATP